MTYEPSQGSSYSPGGPPALPGAGGGAGIGAPPLIMPYATPTPYAFEAVNIWREGPVLIVPVEVSLPDLCVKCNAPADGWRLRKKLSWHPPLLALMILFPGLIFYAIVALIVQKKATIDMGLCPVHRAKRRTAMMVAGGIALSGVVIIVGGGFWASTAPRNDSTGPLLITAGIVVLLIAAVYSLIGPRVLSPKKIDKQFAWLKGAGPDFLSNFPAVQQYR